MIAGNDRHTGLDHQFLGGILQAHGADGAGARADEDKVCGGDRIDEIRVFGQEAIAGMDGLCACGACCRDNGFTAQIAVARGRAADVNRLVREGDVSGLRVGVGIDRNRGDAEFARGLDDTAGDFATVGDQDLFEHLASRGLECAGGYLPPRPVGLNQWRQQGAPGDIYEQMMRGYIRKRPKRVGSMGALRAAVRLSARTSRVLRGSMMPSSQRRAEA